ncbi:hypothetical protein QBC43DRAFT_222137 [Cladorrhinum sp. PSN259]|nr:hypothetical protein QBC43DRAFT_222137 [Cladorrhinum sp. PSN259]
MKTRKPHTSYHIKEKSGILESEKKVIEPESDPACPICQEPVGQKNPDGTTETWSELPCGHRFGSSCIKKYLGIVAEEHPQCPICRERAYHSCNHPVLPVILKGDGTGKQKQAKSDMNKNRPVELLEYSLCDYCKQTYTVGGNRRLGIWGRFYRVLSLRAMRIRIQRRRRIRGFDELIVGTQPTSPIMDYNQLRKFNDNGWALWWARQQPITDQA